MTRVLWLMKKQLDVALDRSVRLEVMNALARLDVEVILVTGYKESPQQFDVPGRIHYVRAPTAPYAFHFGFNVAAASAVLTLVSHWDPDYVIFDPWSVPAILPLVLRRRLHHALTPRLCMDVRTVPVQLSGTKKGLSEIAFHAGIRAGSYLADGVTAISAEMLRVLTSHYGLCTSKPSAVWTSGVSLDRFDPTVLNRDEVGRVRRALGLEGHLAALYHGNLTTARGLGNLIAALQLLNTPGLPEVRLVLLGSGLDCHLLEAQARGLGVQHLVRFVPPVPYDEVPLYIAAADIGVVPLPDSAWWNVSSPVKLMEYLAMARPVVATAIPAHKDVLGDNPCAELVRDASPESLAGGIARWAALTTDERERRGMLGRQIVARRYTWGHQALTITAFLNSLVPPERRQ